MFLIGLMYDQHSNLTKNKLVQFHGYLLSLQKILLFLMVKFASLKFPLR